jgi:hypothetical protein
VSPGARLALIGEARGEFLFLAKIAGHARALLGEDAVVQIELDPADLSDAERASTLVPALEPEFAQAHRHAGEELPGLIAEAEERYGIASLPRLWRSDLAFWRDGADEELLARDALGYLAVFDRLFAENPLLAGGFAEESGRLIKRAFRAVARSHDRRLLIGFPIPLPGRLVFVDQEELDEGMPPWEGFEPSPEQLEYARQLVEQVTSSELQFSEPRDLTLNLGRVRNFGRLLLREVRRSEPGAANAHTFTFARDFALQRARLVVLRRLARRRAAAGRTIFYPLHGSGDSQITIRGDAFRDQLALVDLLASMLPYGYRLLVKPHPIYAGEVPLARLLALRRRRPALEILDASVHAHELLRSVSAVVCVNSTTGFEALMFGVPVVTLGKSLYRGRGLTYDVGDLADLGGALARAVRGPAPDSAGVERLLAYLYAASDDITPIYRDAGDENARRFAETLVRRLAESQPIGRPASSPSTR